MENLEAGRDSYAKTAATTTNAGGGEENPSNNNLVTVADEGADSNEINENGNDSGINNQTGQQPPARTPFANLNQVDADLALARTLQEQERAYMMLRMNGDRIGYGSWEVGSYFHEDDDFDDPSVEEFDDTDADDDDNEEGGGGGEEDAFHAHAHAHAHAEDAEDDYSGIELDPSAYSSDEAYARALQDAEEREMAARLLSLAGINEIAGEAEDADEHGDNSLDAWEEVDPDELSYEELLALGEVVGTESRGLSADTIASLPSMNYKAQSNQDGSSDSCVICRLDYEDGDTLTVLSCKHSYHSECINNWLQINKACPVCNTEVPTSGNS